ncbi:MAG: DUF327 family protein [Spirochaetaceae bacterium]|nr:MAG: DUF327 family protein [Spirochaetaceae bacterium]
MDRVENTGSFFAYRRETREKKRADGKTPAQPIPRFASLLDPVSEPASIGPAVEATSDETDRVELHELLDAVHARGDKLKRHLSADAIQEYKNAVRRFISAVLDGGYSVDERSSAGNVLKRKKFTLISVIDGKIERLASGVFATQRDQIEILRRIDEINGLLVDLLQ